MGQTRVRMNSLNLRAMNCGPLSEMIRGLGARMFFQAPLEDDLGVGLSHGLAQLPVNDEARAAVDVQVGDIDVPVLVRGERLDKAGAFERGLRLPGIEQASALKHPIGARGAHRHDVAIKHHEGERAVTLKRELMLEVDDGSFSHRSSQ